LKPLFKAPDGRLATKNRVFIGLSSTANPPVSQARRKTGVATQQKSPNGEWAKIRSAGKRIHLASGLKPMGTALIKSNVCQKSLARNGSAYILRFQHRQFA
jgi:hypothetical protein